MNCSALLLFLLGLMVSVSSAPTSTSVCPAGCKPVHHQRHQHLAYKPVGDLSTTSVSPWTYRTDPTPDREPESILQAVCGGCRVNGTISKPIYLQIPVYQRSNNDTWCKCPFNLAVGCTCVKE